MFFCRVDKLQDRFEGTIPTLTKQEMFESYMYIRDEVGFFEKQMSDEQLMGLVNEQVDMYNKLRSLNCINCWNEFHGESFALWKVYSSLNRGIMIRSTFENIISAFSESEEEIFCSKLEYIDYAKDSFNPGNTMTPFIHKHRAYSYEKEVRLIHEVHQVEWAHDWESEKYHNGVMIDVNLDELIKEIVISPFSPNWFLELIHDVLRKYSVYCEIKNSDFK